LTTFNALCISSRLAAVNFYFRRAQIFKFWGYFHTLFLFFLKPGDSMTVYRGGAFKFLQNNSFGQ
jgi:hypothetical protein